jgi:UDP-2,4-diacetamido-2,4,6-trideoxy-beta-L-altropyranose hydrolase
VNIGVLTVGGRNVGLGHLARCVSICQAFKTLCGASVNFYDISEESKNWLMNIDSALMNPKFQGSPDLLIIDIGNSADKDVQLRIDNLNSRVKLGIHDVGKFEIATNVILNGAVYGDEINYSQFPDALMLIGPKFQPLRREFWQPKERIVSDEILNVLICLGGGDNVNASLQVYEVARDILRNANFNIVVGPFINAPLASENLIIHRSPSDISSLIRACDIAITGAGQILYELAAFGTPAIAIPMAENQIPNIEYFQKMGLMYMAPKLADPSFSHITGQKISALSHGYHIRVAQAVNQQKMIDGSGALRVAEKILSGETLNGYR